MMVRAKNVSFFGLLPNGRGRWRLRRPKDGRLLDVVRHRCDHLLDHAKRPHAGCDKDATFRLVQRLDKMLRRDHRAYNCYRKIQWPAMLAFTKTVERYGIFVNKDALRQLTREVSQFVETTERELMALIPATLRRAYLERGEEMSFSRDAVKRDILFSKKGFNLKPKVFTKSTEKLTGKEKVPSVSIKDHLPYFKNEPGDAGKFVELFTEWVQCSKLLTTYLGSENQQTGFWQYIAPDGAIYPYYKLHATVTEPVSI